MKVMRSRSHRVKLGLAMAALLTLAACGGGDAPSAQDAAGASPSAVADGTESGSGAAVEMSLIQFRPKQLEVAAGTEVTWTQKDAGSHTVTSGTVDQSGGGVTGRPDNKFRSERLATGQTFKFTFAEPGTYAYFCEIHPATMKGEVRVSA